MNRPVNSSVSGEPGTTETLETSRCASPYCGARLAPGASALVVTATWLPDTKAALCDWLCLVAWSQLMAVGARAHAAGGATMCQVIL